MNMEPYLLKEDYCPCSYCDDEGFVIEDGDLCPCKYCNGDLL